MHSENKVAKLNIKPVNFLQKNWAVRPLGGEPNFIIIAMYQFWQFNLQEKSEDGQSVHSFNKAFLWRSAN